MRFPPAPARPGTKGKCREERGGGMCTSLPHFPLPPLAPTGLTWYAGGLGMQGEARGGSAPNTTWCSYKHPAMVLLYQSVIY